VASFAIRAPSVDELLDPFSVGRLDERPLTDEVRDRILWAWVDTRHDRPSHLTVELPASERREGLAEKLKAAIRHDLEETYQASKKWLSVSRSERRETMIAFGFLIVCLVLSSLMDQATANDAFFGSVSQGLVVLGWVALWTPAQRLFATVSRRLNRKRYQELAKASIEVEWV
jgi:hypothetical protein